MLAKNKLSSIEKLMSQALIGMEISHEEFITILKEKDKYEKMKDNLRSENEKYENMRLSSLKSKTKVKKYRVFYAIKKKLFFFLCMYKMIQISKEGHKKCEVEIIDKGRYFWVNRKDLEVELDVASWAQIFDNVTQKNKNTDKN